MNKKLPIVDQAAGPAAIRPPIRQSKDKGAVAVITLGCAKNQIDSEVMLGALESAGFTSVSRLEDAEYIVINTCGFLESALNESIDCILDAAQYKESGKLRRLVAAGCAVSRYSDKLPELLPEVDAFLTTEQLLQVPAVLTGVPASPAQAPFLYDDTMPRVLSTASHTAYVKIAEGCDRPCTFCVIPAIRGRMRSRSSECVLREVEALSLRGVREVSLIGLDLTSYGRDNGGRRLIGLLRDLDSRRSVPWLRLLYAYPVGVDDELLDAIAELPTVCEYLDIPLQHASELLLKAMKRPLGRLAPRPLVEHIRSRHPEIHLRTTFIVGFPGESEADFAALEEFVGEGHFSSVGVFTFSPEEGTPAALLPGAIPPKIAAERREILMLRQQAVLEARYETLVGKHFEVLLDGPHEESELLLAGRTRFQALEVDGTVIINDSEVETERLRPGTIARVEITGHAGYDLLGTVKEVVME